MDKSNEKENLDSKVYFITKSNFNDIPLIHIGKLEGLSCSAYSKYDNEPWRNLLDYYMYNTIITDDSELLTEKKFIEKAIEYKLEEEKIKELINHQPISDEEIEEMYDNIQELI